MYYCKLTRIESTHQILRTDSVEGMCPTIPEVGKRFFMYSDKPIDPTKDERHVLTSIVQEIRPSSNEGFEIVFRTENSLYSLTNIKVATP